MLKNTCTIKCGIDFLNAHKITNYLFNKRFLFTAALGVKTVEVIGGRVCCFIVTSGKCREAAGWEEIVDIWEDEEYFLGLIGASSSPVSSSLLSARPV